MANAIGVAVGVLIVGLIFSLVLGVVVYVYPPFPYALILLAGLEWLYLFSGAALLIFGKMNDADSPGRLGGLAVLVSLWLMNNYMMFLAKQWGIQIDMSGWYMQSLTAPNVALAATGTFLSDWLHAISGADFTAVKTFFDGLSSGLADNLPDVGAVGDWSGRIAANVVMGALSGILSAIVIRMLFKSRSADA